MKIQIIGTGCKTCKTFFENTKKIAQDLNLDIEFDYVEDEIKLIEKGVMQSPILLVDGEIMLIGKGHSDEVIKEVLLNKVDSKKEDACGHGCSSCRGC